VSQGYVQRIAAAGSTLLTLVNDILDFSKLEGGPGSRSGGSPPTWARSPARPWLCSLRRRRGKGLELSLELAGPGVPGTVMVDPRPAAAGAGQPGRAML